MEELRCKVVPLPHNQKATKKKTDLVKSDLTGLIDVFGDRTIEEGWTVQYLYLTSSREIQSGDWVYYKLPIIETWGIGQFFGGNPDKTSLKVEATTDPSLKLALIQQSFVEEYVQMQGKIEEVRVVIDLKQRVHTRTDGTCIIHPIKDSWTREELKPLLDAVMEYADVMVSKKRLPIHLDNMLSERARLLNLIEKY